MNAVKIAMANVHSALQHRARIGAELNPNTASPMLVQWYEDALAAEDAARAELRAAIEVERHRQLHAAYLL